MHRRVEKFRVTWIATGLLLVAGLVAYATVQVAALGRDIQYLVTARRNTTMQKLTQQVARQDGSIVTVETTRNEGEATADWIARHDEAVAAVKAS